MSFLNIAQKYKLDLRLRSRFPKSDFQLIFNGYFQKKQESYAQSKVGILLELSEANNDWGLDEIRERDIRISDELVELLKEWGLNQVDGNEDKPILIQYHMIE